MLYSLGSSLDAVPLLNRSLIYILYFSVNIILFRWVAIWLIIKFAYSKTVKQNNKQFQQKFSEKIKNLREFNSYTIIIHYAIAFCVEMKETLFKLPKSKPRNFTTLVKLSQGLTK